jgi:hypothetical protein
MSQSTRRLGVVCVLLALVGLVVLSGCSSGTDGTVQKATTPGGPRATPTSHPGSSTPSPTSTPTIACSGALSDIVLPAHAVQVGHTSTTGATTSCAYRIPQDSQTLDAFFKTQMGNAGWTLLHDDTEGPQSFVQVYFKAQRFATITLSQSDAHTTDVTITVESSQ